MAKVFDRLIMIEKIDEATEKWERKFFVHAAVNKRKSNDEYLNGGAIQGKQNLVFEVRYFKDLEDIADNIQSYRIIFGNTVYDIKDFDDFMFQHKTVKLLGVSY